MPQRATVTIREVARAAGVSVTTASRVLNQSPTVIPVSSNTKERIRRAAAQLGYQPNLLARALRSRQTHLLGCLFADMTDPFLHPIAQAAQRTAWERGYRLLSADTAEQPQEVVAGSEVFDRALVDGMFILGAMLDEAPDAVEQVIQNYPCVVAFGRGGGDHPVSVGVDNELGARLLLNHSS
ncbi:MAG: LacI family transcriptional regulator, partial [Chloroflexi bacterium]|nr:LacI family transcriptional regulator [Chloroflexota bacterium]